MLRRFPPALDAWRRQSERRRREAPGLDALRAGCRERRAPRRGRLLDPVVHKTFSLWALTEAHALHTIPGVGSQPKMSHLSREQLDLVNRTKKVIGQLESVLRALNEDEKCADVLQRLAAARGSINSLMAELMEDHIRNHMDRKKKSSAEAAEDLIEIVHAYLK